MNQKIEETSTKDYFEQVMDGWREGMASSEHPYAKNKSWQQRYQSLKQWVAELNLSKGRVLEVGCGTGLLQDVVENYVGVDIAWSSKQYMHKPFVTSSAIRLPFPSNTFDGVWSFWVLEHVGEPEMMLSEMRRVTKPGGTIFLVAAYGVDSWVSQGIHKRSFSELTHRQKLIKLTIPLRASIPYKVIANLPRRMIDAIKYHTKINTETHLRYKQLDPNYDIYWDYDADACVSLDSHSVVLYFLSRGDQSWYPLALGHGLLQRSQPQAYIVQK